MFRIDAHHHFWKYDPVQYGWISEKMNAIRRDFLPQDLQQEMAAAGVNAAISVQVRQTLEETRWLLDFAGRYEFVKGVVGWAPLVKADVSETLAEVAMNPKLRAVRHVLQDEPDPLYILRDDFNRGIRELKPLGLAYDILIFERHLPQTIQFVDKHPGQIFIVDHLAKPRVRDGELSPWRENIQALAQRPNVYCKLSGLVTEADYASWTPEQLQPYFETVLSAFTPRRLLFGSDWPVCLVAVDYSRWVSVVANAIGALSQTEQARIWSETAMEAYGLDYAESEAR